MSVEAGDDQAQVAGATYGAVAELFAALAAPVRSAIVHQLTVRELSVGELAEHLEVSQPLVSQHLRTLRQAGVVEGVREGRTVSYRLADEHVAHIFLDAYQHTREHRGAQASEGPSTAQRR